MDQQFGSESVEWRGGPDGYLSTFEVLPGWHSLYIRHRLQGAEGSGFYCYPKNVFIDEGGLVVDLQVFNYGACYSGSLSLNVPRPVVDGVVLFWASSTSFPSVPPDGLDLGARVLAATSVSRDGGFHICGLGINQDFSLFALSQGFSSALASVEIPRSENSYGAPTLYGVDPAQWEAPTRRVSQSLADLQPLEMGKTVSLLVKNVIKGERVALRLGSAHLGIQYRAASNGRLNDISWLVDSFYSGGDRFIEKVVDHSGDIIFDALPAGFWVEVGRVSEFTENPNLVRAIYLDPAKESFSVYLY